MSFDTTLTLIALHPKLDGYFLLLLEDYKLNQNLELFFDHFKLTILMHAPFIGEWSVWDGFWTPSRLFSPKRFNIWVPSIISALFSYSHIPPRTHVLGATCLLVMIKPLSRICLIVVGESLYRL
jgi:hypothetical protein